MHIIYSQFNTTLTNSIISNNTILYETETEIIKIEKNDIKLHSLTLLNNTGSK